MEQALVSQNKQIVGSDGSASVRQHHTQMPYRPGPSSAYNATDHKNSTSADNKVAGPPTKKRQQVGNDWA
jgi:hypothetical protein